MADFHSQNCPIGQEIFCLHLENVALNLNSMLRVTKYLLCQIQSARTTLLSGNQPLKGWTSRPPSLNDFSGIL